MNGRVENDLKIFAEAENKLIECPKFIISWYYYLKANGRSAMSCREYLYKITQFLRFVDNDISIIEPEDFNEDVITQYFLKIKNKDDYSETSISYRQEIWSCLNNLFKFMYKRKLIPYNYFEVAGIERPKGNDIDNINRKRKYLTKEDFKKILQAIEDGAGSNKAKGYQKRFKNRDKAIMLIFMTTGMRKTALKEINVEDINIERKTLTIIDKGHKSFTYYLNDDVVSTINQWLIDRFFIMGKKEGGALFISKEGTRMCNNSITKLVDKYAKEGLGYHISPHKLRSGFASIMYEETKDIEFVRRAIGHSKIETTQRYIVTENTEREKASMIMLDILS